MKPLAFALVLALPLAGCNASAPPQAAAPVVAVAAPDAHPGAQTCAAEIARYRAIQEQDLSMGHVAQSVYTQIQAEIAAADAKCAAGDDALARRMIVASKAKHGYPVGL